MLHGVNVGDDAVVEPFVVWNQSVVVTIRVCGRTAQHGAGGDHQGGQSQRLIRHIVSSLANRCEAVAGGGLRKPVRPTTASASALLSGDSNQTDILRISTPPWTPFCPSRYRAIGATPANADR